MTPRCRNRQRLAFRIDAAGGLPVKRHATATTVRVGDGAGISVRPVGLGSAPHRIALSERDVERLQALGPAHVRVDLRPGGLETLFANLEARPKTVRLGPVGPAVVRRPNEDRVPDQGTERVVELTEPALAPFETVGIDT
jgi:hypothetical protein